MREQAQARLLREWREDLPAILDGIDTRPYPMDWAIAPDDQRPQMFKVPMKDVLETVCFITGFDRQDILSANRRKKVSKRRHMTMYLMSRLCVKRTTNEIARFLDRDPTTVTHAIDGFTSILAANPDLALEYDQCCRHFGIKP